MLVQGDDRPHVQVLRRVEDRVEGQVRALLIFGLLDLAADKKTAANSA